MQKRNSLVAKQLSKLGVDIIEAGFPIASEGDFDAVSKIAKTVGNQEDPSNHLWTGSSIEEGYIDLLRCY